MHPLAQLDHRYVWHPFTQMRDWLRQEPIVIASGDGAVLRDVRGREYLDANSSIWTNLHGHHHPKINAAIARQLDQIAHSSALGLANKPASLLAEKLVQLAHGSIRETPRRNRAAHRQVAKVFYSDDGSTAIEVALKLAYEFSRRARGLRRPRFLSLEGAYHGDTLGAVSLGHIDLFHRSYAGLLFPTDRVPAPYCYRCPFNRAKPERADARTYRRCQWECLSQVEQACARRQRREPYAAFFFEPLIQGAAGMIAQPPGWLRQVTDIARSHGALLIADEVMTAFGRTGAGVRTGLSPPLLAVQHESVKPDLICLAKGLTGGYLPLAATLTTQDIFDAFLGEYDEFKTFFHGHSYTGNQLGTASALANLELLHKPAAMRARLQLEVDFSEGLETLWPLPHVGDIRRVGLVAGVELVRDWRTREPYPLAAQAGLQVCAAMARRGVLTRPIGNVVTLLPPYCTRGAQLDRMLAALAEAIEEVLR